MKRSPLELALAHGFVDGQGIHRSRFTPLLIDNQQSFTMSRAIISELRHADSFIFSVAFITPSALNVLKQDLLDFEGDGTIITSNYLGFNSPATYRELLNFPNLRVKVVEARHGFHAKGYIFRGNGQTTAIVGSSNLTVSALSSNLEWNFRFSAQNEGHVVRQIEEAIRLQERVADTVDAAWIEDFERSYKPRVPTSWLDQRASHLPEEALLWDINAAEERRFEQQPTVTPNKMQESALASLSELRSAGKASALVVSATGTGKTILAGLDVRAFDPDRLLFLAHREQILDKASEEFKLVLEADRSQFGKLSGSSRDLNAKYLFATTQSFIRAVRDGQVAPDTFDYVIIDEVHRAGAQTYIQIVDFLKPRFMLGMTATPERTDNFNVFELFDYNLAYEIRLQQALEENMLAPFHYFGVTDYTTGTGETIDAYTDLRHLASEERADHLVRKLEQYGQVSVPARGLIFCSRNDEARELSELLNCRTVYGNRLRTKAVSGDDSVDYREQVVKELECGALDYLLSVDIFNEGIDIPSLNQIVMLRQTQSAIVFTQQLGRGLRKHHGKDYLVAIDFIGNYANNYLIPTALFGDASNNKEQLRRRLIGNDGDHIIAGISSINFDKIAKERVLASLAAVKLDSMAKLKEAYQTLRARLGRPPMLADHLEHEASDPLVVGMKEGNYARFVSKVESDRSLRPRLSVDADLILTFLTNELLNGKRPQELLLLSELLKRDGPVTATEYRNLLSGLGLDASDRTLTSVERVLSLEWFTDSERKKYGGRPLVAFDGTCFHLGARWRTAWDCPDDFRSFASDVIRTGLEISSARFGGADSLVVGERYTRKDVCRLLNWQKNEQSTVYGYKVDRDSNTCPIFVTYHKADDITESTKYGDRFIDQQTLHWFTRSNRTFKSREVDAIVNHTVPIYLFVKKDDAEGTDFIYLGEVTPTDAEQTAMPGEGGLPVVTMNLELPEPIDGATFDYLTGAL